MQHTDLEARLSSFRDEKRIRSKGALAVVLHLTRYAREQGLPLSAKCLMTEGSGQVLGLGKGAVQRVLADHGITQVLAEEGGRTSRGSIGIMQAYVAFLNDLHLRQMARFDLIEAWWIERIREHFSAKPLRLRFDPAKGLQAMVADLMGQALKRQRESTGAMIQGAVLQHLVGAKLELAVPEAEIQHHGASVADACSDRAGDFVIDDSVIHITTSPGEAVIRKCKRNLETGGRPIILTLADGVIVARALAENAGLAGRIDILDAEQFVTANLHELSLFRSSARSGMLERLIETYNRIVAEHETDPGLRIELGGR
jgi:hypothetical protein